jgi:hypothetical protein
VAAVSRAGHVPAHMYTHQPPGFSPDGRYLVFVQPRQEHRWDTGHDLLRVRLGARCRARHFRESGGRLVENVSFCVATTAASLVVWRSSRWLM